MPSILHFNIRQRTREKAYCLDATKLILRAGAPKAMYACARCQTDISASAFFYTVARNSYMFGFFCSHDCAQESEHNKHLRGTVLRVSQPPDTHKEMVLVPDVSMLKKYNEELKKRKIREKYF